LPSGRARTQESAQCRSRPVPGKSCFVPHFERPVQFEERGPSRRRAAHRGARKKARGARPRIGSRSCGCRCR
jgi:hypothetical protein